MFFTFYATLAFAGTGFGISIDSKLELPNPTFSSLVHGDRNPILDSSLSPKVIKAFYEINFVPVSRPEQYNSNGILSLSEKSSCPYSKELCKYLYFVPSKISTVQKVDELISSEKENEVPVIQGIVSKNEADSFLRQVNNTVNSQVNKVVNISNTIDRSGNSSDVPVYKGTIQTQEVLNKPEYRPYPSHPPRPYYPPTNRPNYQWTDYGGWRNNPCLQGPCQWRTPFSSSIMNPSL